MNTHYRVVNLNGNYFDKHTNSLWHAVDLIEKRHTRLVKRGRITYFDMNGEHLLKAGLALSVTHVKAGCKWYAIIEMRGP